MNAKKNNASRTAATTTTTATNNGEMNRSQAIRDYVAQNPTAKQSDVVAGLKAAGTEVTASLVSSVLRRGTVGDKVAVATIKEAAAFIKNFDGGIDEAKKAIETVGGFVMSCGSATEAIGALDAYEALAAAIK